MQVKMDAKELSMLFWLFVIPTSVFSQFPDNWTKLPGGTEQTLIDVAAFSSDSLFTIDEDEKISATFDGGNTWKERNPQTGKEIKFSALRANPNQQSIIAVGDDSIYRNTNMGENWELTYLGSVDAAGTVTPVSLFTITDDGTNYDAHFVYAVGEKGTVLKSVNDGVDWEKKELNIGANTCLSVGNGGTELTKTDTDDDEDGYGDAKFLTKQNFRTSEARLATTARGIEKSDIRRGFFVALSGGITNPTGDYKSYSQINTNADGQVLFGATEEIAGKIHFNLDAGYQFGAFGMGLSLGSLKHEISEVNLQSDLVNLDFPLHTNGGELDGTYYGIGPEYTLAFGKFSTKASTRIGLVDFSTSTFTGSYNGDDVDVPVELIHTELGSDKKTSLAYSSVGLQLSYAISRKISVFGKSDYAFALGDGLQVTDAGVIPRDIDRDKRITAFDVQYLEEGIPFENIRTVKPRMVNVGFGLTYNFNAPKIKGRTDKTPPFGKEIKVAKDVDVNTDTQRAADLKKLADELVNAFAFDDVTWSMTFSDKTEMPPRDIDKPFLMTKGTDVAKPSQVATNNPNTEDNTKRATGNLGNMYPPGSNTKPSRFGSFDDIEYFAWEYIGKEIPNANYIIEITKIADNGQAQQIFIGQIAANTHKNALAGEEISSVDKKVAKFKAGKALADVVKRTGNPDEGDEDTMTDDGLYTWKVTETTTGISSEPGFFTISKKLGNVHGYDENSAMLVVKIDQSALRNTNTVIDPESELLSGKRDVRMNIRALRIHDVRHGIRARRYDARMKSARTNDERIKNIRMNAKDRRYEDALRTNSALSEKAIITITDENFKVAPESDIDTKYLRIKNMQHVQIPKGSLQLIAPLLSVQNVNDTVTYDWKVTNKEENKERAYNGNSIYYGFNNAGTFAIEITPSRNGQKLEPYRILVVVK
ncbi:MAG: hypothetical protein K0B11_09345 [Mariniphaga sp.]|nr:hypothetical protein [Mariniphaga sp.]